MANKPELPKLSHGGLARKVDTIDKRRAAALDTSPGSNQNGPLATLQSPTTKSDSVSVHGGNMIVVNGVSGHFTYDFDISEGGVKAYFDITYASGDVRKLVLRLNDMPLDADFCASETGGFTAEFYKDERYGPFPLARGRNTLHVTTNNFYFPHLHEIRVINAKDSTGDAIASRSLNSSRKVAAVGTRTVGKFTWIAPPTGTVRADLAQLMLKTFCSLEVTQDPNPNFVPDPSFYNAINCDGLWVCASKQVKMEVLHRACHLVCRYVPIEIRRACLQWRAPKGRPEGPFRLIILDHVTNQKAGDCPEFPDTWGGRNSTSNPACFTSANDLEWVSAHDEPSNPFFGGPRGELTVHEMTHMIDMVVRQQIDPYFMQQVDDVWQANRNTYKKSYAYSDRHEYLAEITTLFVGCRSANFKRGCAGCASAPSGCCTYAPHAALPAGKCGVDFVKKSHLRENDRDGYELLKSFLMEIREPENDKFWWE